ncbi:MAG: hypothetical protein KR126chlam3_01237 [Chlamydiae bacterium]|nr:hypothetical protein [Chlamydiota bacterium]
MKMNALRHFVFYSFLFLNLLADTSVLFTSEKSLINKISTGCPEWMQEQIDKDLAPYMKEKISIGEMNQRFLEFPPEFYVVKFIIKDNQIFIENLFEESGVNYRLEGFENAFKDLCSSVGLPDVTFFVFLHDGLSQPDIYCHELVDFPLFVMSRASTEFYDERSIFIPDYEGLRQNYQVLKKKDVVQFEFPWEKKKSRLVWRGSTAQSGYDNSIFPCYVSAHMNHENATLFTRFIVCQFSQKYPHVIDAKFTFLADLENTFPYIKKLQGAWMSYEKQFSYKYHILLNGNAAPYTNSGWKFFSNSLLFIPENYWTQWYYGALKPYIHYVPTARHLEDLYEKIQWAQEHDQECKVIAKNARDFAMNNLTRMDSLVYIYFLLSRYSLLIVD